MDSAMKNLVSSFLAILISLLALAGCGGSGTDGGGPSLPGDGLPGATLPGATAAAAPIRYGDVITLKSAFWRQYLSAQNGNSVQQARYPLEWEQWEIIDPDNGASKAAVQFNGKFRLKSVAKDSWLSAQNNSAIEQASAPLAWEVWQFRDLANSTATGTVTEASGVVLRNLNWSTYLSGRQGTGVGQAPEAKGWEQWLVYKTGYKRDVSKDTSLHYGDVITARGSFRTYLSAQGTIPLGLADHPAAWEKWEIANPDEWTSTAAMQLGGKVALYAVDRGRFLSAQTSSNTEQVAEPHQWEEWTIVNAAKSTGSVKPLDTVEFKSPAWNTYLSAQQTVAKHVDNEGPWEQWIVAPDGYFGNWMAWEAMRSDVFGKKPLREITLPASHDSGTWSFRSEISNDPEAVAGYMKAPLDTIAAVPELFLGAIGNIEIGGFTIPLSTGLGNDLRSGFSNAIYDSLRPLSQATRRTTAQQLSEGIRWLDLRIDLAGDGRAYTYHFLRGVDMAGVLDDVAAFLAASSGEIVVLEMSHFTMDLISKNLPAEAVRTAKYDAFTAMVDTKLEAYKYEWASGKASPFVTSYHTLLDASPKGSKVIIIMDDIWEGGPSVHDRKYWKSEDLGLTGKYAKKSNVADMVKDQVDKFHARDQDKAFKLYMTLTGQPDELVARTVSGIAGRFMGVAYDLLWGAALGPIRWVPGVEGTLRSWVNDAVSWALSKVGLSVQVFAWNSLWDLSQMVNPSMHSLLDDWFQSLNMATTNDLSVIYADFTDTTFLVETAIRYSRLPAKTSPTSPP